MSDHATDVPTVQILDDSQSSSNVQSAKENSSLKERSADFTTDVIVVPNQEIQQDIVSSEIAGNDIGDYTFVCVSLFT